MNPLVALLALQTPLVAKDAGLSLRFPGEVKLSVGQAEFKGKEVCGDLHWYRAKSGRFDAESLYKSDTLRTKEADATKGFAHVRTTTTFTGIPAIQSDQTYQWNGVEVVSRCVYAAQNDRAWVIRLWWPKTSVKGLSVAEAFFKSLRRLP